MSDTAFPETLAGYPVYMVGIKGTGMSALAEILVRMGADVSGSDTAEHFYTDEVLRSVGVPFAEGFRAENVPSGSGIVIYSAAYNPADHVELLRASELGIPLVGYNVALGVLSRRMPSGGISGVHGKTTTTAMAGMMVKELGFPGIVLAGSAVSGFQGRSTLFQGDRFFLAETCEYRRHFLHFSPRNIIMTSVEADHLDYFRDLEDIFAAFGEYVGRLSPGGSLIYCADDAGAVEVADRVRKSRHDIDLVPYGIAAEGPYHVEDIRERSGEISFRVRSFADQLSLHIPGRHNVLNATAALALVQKTMADLDIQPVTADGFEKGVGRALAAFRGSTRRSEIIGEVGGVMIMDDYAHHPTAIEKTLSGIASFFPGRRIVVDFMSHTYSRTAALLPAFARAFTDADVVITHRIYASAREKQGSVTGEDLANAIRNNHPDVRYFAEVLDAEEDVLQELKPGDIFVTMGAGDNWRLGRAVFSALSRKKTGVAR